MGHHFCWKNIFLTKKFNWWRVVKRCYSNIVKYKLLAFAVTFALAGILQWAQSMCSLSLHSPMHKKYFLKLNSSLSHCLTHTTSFNVTHYPLSSLCNSLLYTFSLSLTHTHYLFQRHTLSSFLSLSLSLSLESTLIHIHSLTLSPSHGQSLISFTHSQSPLQLQRKLSFQSSHWTHIFTYNTLSLSLSLSHTHLLWKPALQIHWKHIYFHLSLSLPL